MFNKLLQQITQADMIASLSWGDSGLQVGKVLGWNDEEILIAHISAGGYYDGYVLRPLDGLFQITFGGRYEQKMQKLYAAKTQHHALVRANNDNLWNSILEYAFQAELILSAEHGSASVTGYIEDWDDAALKLRVLDQFGMEDGSAIVLRDEIDLLAVDTDYEQDLRLLKE